MPPAFVIWVSLDQTAESIYKLIAFTDALLAYINRPLTFRIFDLLISTLNHESLDDIDGFGAIRCLYAQMHGRLALSILSVDFDLGLSE